MSEAILNEIEIEAKNYIQKPEDELSKILLLKWKEINGSDDTISTKGDPKNFLSKVINRLAKKIIENRGTVSTAFGMAVGEVVAWANNQGYDLTQYKIFISVMAAAVANSVLDELKKSIS